MSKFVLTAQLQLQAPNNVGQVVRQMQSQLSNVNVNVQAKQLPKTTANVNNLTKSLGQANSAAYKLGKTFTSSLKRFAAFSVATRAVSLFTQGIGGAIAEAANFERELIKVAQVTGKSMSALKGLSDEITKLSTNLGVSSNELLNVSRALSQAGFSARETKTALEALAKSDLAPTFENMTKTAEGAIAIFNQFGQGARALEGQLGAINAIAGKFAVEAGDLISVVRRTGGVFKAAGGDLNELLALFTSVRATTRESAESIATGLRTIFTRIQRPSTLKYLDSLGVKLTDVEGKFVGPYEAIRRLSEALSGLEAGDLQFVKIAEQLGGFRQIGKVIPLLMQFGVAQEAYNTALDGTTSLTKDAQTAQGSLLVQVQKLKEEWLALVRGFTSSPGFKILAQTAISLATALIKVADTLKNILPIMMAIGSVKLFSGFGGFMAGAKGAMGAAVPKFASGGMVPGSGNRDTVPALLTPGEFVIRKSSVKKLGAQNLKNMNAKGYASGGPVVTLNDNALGGFFLRPQGGTDRDGKLNPKTATGIMSNPDAIKRLRRKAGVPQPELKKTKESALGALSPPDAHKKFGGKLNVKGVSEDTPIIKDGEVNSTLVKHYAVSTGQSETDARKSIQDDISGLNIKPAAVAEKIKVGVEGNVKGLILGQGDSETTGAIESLVKQNSSDGLRTAITDTMNSDLLKKVTKKSDQIHIDKDKAKKALEKNLLAKGSDAVATISGYVQEGLINNITGAPVAGGGTRLDFPTMSSQTRERLKILYGDDGGVKAADAKPEAKGSNFTAIGNKYIGEMDGDLSHRFIHSDFISSIKSPKKGFASGGPAPSDTVPALLTPGEFVINKKAAQSIGSANLDRMNKRGVQGFAKGGPVGGVQRFNMGGGVMGGGVAILAILPMLQQAFESLGQSSDEVNDVFNALKDGIAAGIGTYIGLTTILQMRQKRAQEAANAEANNTKTTMTFGQQIQAAGQWLTSVFTGKPQAGGGGGGQQQNVGTQAALRAGATQAGTADLKKEAPAAPAPKTEQKAGSVNKFDVGSVANMEIKSAQNVIIHAQKVSEEGKGGGAAAPAKEDALAPMKKMKTAKAEAEDPLLETKPLGTTKSAIKPAAGADESGEAARKDALAKNKAIQDDHDQQVASAKDKGRISNKSRAVSTALAGEMAVEEVKKTQADPASVRREKTAQILEKNLPAVQAEKQADMEKAQGRHSGHEARAQAAMSGRVDDMKMAAGYDTAMAPEQQIGKVPASATRMDVGKGVYMDKRGEEVGQIPAGVQKEMLETRQKQFSTPRMIADEKVAAEQAKAAAKADRDTRAVNEGAMKQGLKAEEEQIQKNMAEQDQVRKAAEQQMGKQLDAQEKQQIDAELAKLPSQKEIDAQKVAVPDSVDSLTAGVLPPTPPEDDLTKGVVKGKRDAFGPQTRQPDLTQIPGGPGEPPDDGRMKRQFEKEAQKDRKKLHKADIKTRKKAAKDIIKDAQARKKSGKRLKLADRAVIKTARFRARAMRQGNSKLKQAMMDTPRVLVNGFKGAAKAIGKAGKWVSGKLAKIGPAALGAAQGLATAAKSYVDAKFERALKAGDATAAREMMESKLTADAVAERVGGASQGAMMGALMGPLGVVVGGTVGAFMPEIQAGIGGAVQGMMDGGFSIENLRSGFAQGIAEMQEKRRQKVEAQVAQVDLENFNESFNDNIKAIRADEGATGPETGVSQLASGFQTAQKAIAAIEKVDPKAAKNAQKQLDKQAVDAATAVGSVIKSEAELEKRIQELGVSLDSDVREKMMNAAKAAFAAAEAMRAVAAIKADILVVTSIFGAANLAVDNFVGSLKTGANTMDSTVRTLQEAQKNIALGKGGTDAIRAARKEIFDRSGIDPDSAAGQAIGRQFDVMEQAADFNARLPDFLKNTKISKGDDLAKVKDDLVNNLTSGMGIDEDSEIGKIIAGKVKNLTDEQIQAIQDGKTDLSTVLGDMGAEVAGLAEGALKAAQALQKHEATMLKLTQQRIKQEQALVAAQQKAIDLQIQAAKIAEKAGGQALTREAKRRAALDRVSLATSAAGVGGLGSATGAGIQAMSGRITQAFGMQEFRSQLPGAFGGTAGLDADKRQALQKANQALIKTTQDLIAIEQDELRIIKEKNRLEQQSLDKLLGGDIQGFLDSQAAAAATSALATGSQSLINMFGATELAGAFKNIQQQQKAGVQTIGGIDIRTVAQAGATAALGARGVNDPRSAAVLAGTTQAENEANRRIRDLAGGLSAIGENAATMAEMQVDTANINIKNAQMQFDASIQDAAGRFSRGGPVYASTGMFIPRGTDTVPAMLTPGEFVINRAAVNRGNNLQILKAINSGASAGAAQAMSSGGQVGYYQNGGQVTNGLSMDLITKLSESLRTFNTNLADNITKLQNTKFQIRLDTTNVNVNINSGGFLRRLKSEVKDELLKDVGNKIRNLKVNNDGRLEDAPGVVQ
tara:strand:+ start:2304 stop:9656 length:7353 start_codon:yes stop_codon:yes gene_type:complete